MSKDKFWKYFLAACATLVIGGGAAVYGIVKFVSPQSLPAIVLPQNGLTDPFSAHAQTPLVATTSEYFFQESVPFGYDKWSWGATVDWRDASHHFDGEHSLAVAFNEEWSGIEIEGPGTITSGYNGIALALYAEPGMENLYLELYKKDGTFVGRQLINWYLPGHALQPGTWQEAAIPLVNFDGTLPAEIGRVSVIAEKTGKAYIDSVRLVRNAQPQAPWVLPSDEEVVEVSVPTISELVQQTTPAPLPYRMEFTPLAAGLWSVMNGSFQFAPTEALLGLTPTSTDSAALFLAGGRWTNYRVDTTLDWGTPSTYSIFVRFIDENNFASCAFSTYGMYAQIYQIQHGESKLIAETPELAIPPVDAWKNVSHGAEVSGDRVTCFLNGEKVLSAELPTLPPAGTIGFEAWSRDPGGTPHRIKAVTVSAL